MAAKILEPAYLALWRDGRFSERAEAARAALAECRSCPRDCRVNRLRDERGVCHTGRLAQVSSAFAHHGEEDCLRGRRGSGTIFFARCNLACVFCQNADISQGRPGQQLTPTQLAEVMLALQATGCHNLNLVTPEHVVPQVLEALALAIPAGLTLPIVYNTSGYDSLRSLEWLDGIVDVYLPDFKLWRAETSRRLLQAEDYPEAARSAIAEMHRQVGTLSIDEDGLARRGVLVRHLVLPGLEEESAAILEWLARELSVDTFVNLMEQYRPANRVGGIDHRDPDRFAEIDRVVRKDELESVKRTARMVGLHRFG